MVYYKKLSHSIQAVTFDLDDTLYDNHPYMLLAEKKLLTYLHSHYPLSKQSDIPFWRKYKIQALINDPALESDMGALRRQTLEAGLHACGYAGSELKEAINNCFNYFYFERSNFKVNKTVCSSLARLAKQVPLVAITNGNVNLKQIGIDGYFQTSFHARHDQPMKPHKKMFQLAQDFLELPAHNILHVGDNMEKDVAGAINAGFQAAWYACNRPMDISKERIWILPHVQLNNLNELIPLL